MKLVVRAAALVAATACTVAGCRSLVGYEDTEATVGHGGSDGGGDASAGMAGAGGSTGASGGSAGVSGAAGVAGAAGAGGVDAGASGGSAGAAGSAGSAGADAGPALWSCPAVLSPPVEALNLSTESNANRRVAALFSPRALVQDKWMVFARPFLPAGDSPVHWIRSDGTKTTTGNHKTAFRLLNVGRVGADKLGLLFAQPGTGSTDTALVLSKIDVDDPAFTNEVFVASATDFGDQPSVREAKFIPKAGDEARGVYVANVDHSGGRTGFAGSYGASGSDPVSIFQGDREGLRFARSESLGKMFVFVRNDQDQYLSYVVPEPPTPVTGVAFGPSFLQVADVHVDDKQSLRLFVWNDQDDTVSIGELDVGSVVHVDQSSIAEAVHQPGAAYEEAAQAMRWSQSDLLGVAPSSNGKVVLAVWYHEGELRFAGTLATVTTGGVAKKAVAVVDPSQDGIWVFWVEAVYGTSPGYDRVMFQRFDCEPPV